MAASKIRTLLLIKSLLIAVLLWSATAIAFAEARPNEVMPVRGFCISAPGSNSLNEFIAFINDELVPRHVNTLVLRVDYRYQYESHPELRAGGALSREAVKKLVAVCKTNGVRIIPHINLLGHQSWAGTLGNLLREYPEFD